MSAKQEKRRNAKKQPDRKPPEQKGVAHEAARYVKENFSREISLDTVARALYVNQTYLSFRFRQDMGMTFREYLNSVRIKEAERLLCNTDLTLLTITYACGYQDQSYFTKVFKRYTGMTPRQCRKG